MKKRITALTALAGAALVLSGCAVSAPAASVPDGPIKVALIAPLESQVVSMPELEASLHAAVESVNAAGGVKKRQIEYTVCNDKWSPDDLRRCVQGAIKNGAVAVFGGVSPHGAQTWPMLEAAHLASIGVAPITPIDAQSPSAFPLYGGTVSYLTFPAVAKQQFKAKKVVALHVDTAAAKTTEEYFQVGSKMADVQMLPSITIPPDAVDFAPYVSRAMASGADAILSAMSASTHLKLFKALKAAGSKIPVLVSSGATPEAILKEAGSAAEGVIVVAGTPELTKEDKFGSVFLADMDKYAAPGTAHTQIGFTVWAGLHLFAEVANDIDGEITAKSVLAAMNAVTDKKFMWFDSLTYSKPGPYEKAPRISSWMSFVNKAKSDGTTEFINLFDPFA